MKRHAWLRRYAGRMNTGTIRLAYPSWPNYNRHLRDAVAALSEQQLAAQPSPERWPLWATVGHLACQRVSGLCGFAGEPGAESTPFPNALYECPGDEDLEHVLGPAALADALDSTFAIIERCLDTWTFDMLNEVIERQFPQEKWSNSRGAVIQPTFAHDVWHMAELNEAFTAGGVPALQPWD
jgi:hypothetical protein